ncbi:MAG TPA: multicopper oxidase family protein, partial [Gemmatimonadaceae bacterium]
RAAGLSIEAPLNCLELYPTPDLGAASGTIALKPVVSPFGVAVTVDGRTRYRLRASIAGLPDPRTLGDYTVYVAWVTTVSLDSAVKLGTVRNGELDLGETSYMQFRILISAERSSNVRRRSGRLVLRGTSPSARLLAHRDLSQPSAIGALADTGRTVSVAAAGHAMHASAGSATAMWSMPPMPPMPPRTTMMPGMHGMIPTVEPFLPTATSSASARSIIRAKTGDTISLASRAVSTTINGVPVSMFGYNGSIPGPLIDVRQGASIVARSRNDVSFPGSIHWHGVRLDNASDGAVGLTQQVVAPGDSFDYRLRFPDAGIFWYHPHVREDVQQALGLYGNILVRPIDAAYYSPVDREDVLMLSDVLLGDGGLTPFGATSPTHALMGRWGNVVLVNGEVRPRFSARRGDVIRYFLTNASSARTYNLSFSGARMKIVAGDGGKFEREEWVTSVVIAPSERYVVEVELAREGEVLLLNRVQALDHMIGTYAREVDTLAAITVGTQRTPSRYSGAFATLRRNADVRSSLAPFRGAFDRPVDHELALTLRTTNLRASIANMLIGVNAPLEWNDGMSMMNWLTTGQEVSWILRDPATGKENMDIDWRFRRGEVVKVRIFNDPSSSHAMAHPIHLHGQRFLVLTRDGVRSQNLVWKDTALIPAGETVELLVDMSNPGRWMLHCHIAEHLSGGMMASFVVE